MCRNGKYLCVMGLAVAGLVVGCQMTTPQPANVAVAPHPEAPEGEAPGGAPADDPHGAAFSHGGGAAGDRDGLKLFGDHPEEERVPFENRLITNLSRHTETEHGLDFDPDIFDDDDLLVFASTRNSERPDIFLKRVDGAALTQLTSDPADDIQPRFAPGGERVLFSSNRGGSWDIWMIERDGTGLTQLTNDPTDEVAPTWSPDGSQVAYTLWGRRSRQWEIWTLSLTQPGVRRFLVYGMFPVWSPDGGRLAFQRARQRGSHLFSVWTIDLVAGEARHPTEVAYRDSAACIAPCWSPDGRMIVYCTVNGDGSGRGNGADTPSSADLWVVELESGLRMKLTDGADPSFNPVWADGGRVFFVSPRSGTENIWSLTTQFADYAAGGSASPHAVPASLVATPELTED